MTEPLQLDDADVVAEDPPRGGAGGAIGWIALILVLGAVGGAVFTVYMPMREENTGLRAQLDEATAQTETLQSGLDTAKAEHAAATVEVEQLRARASELETAHQQAVAEKDAAVAALERVQKELANTLGSEIASGEVEVSRRGDEVVIDVSDQILFEAGDATLNERGQKVLLRVGETVKGMPERRFQIGGHTDSTPLSEATKARWPTNWELSAARATTVVRFLEEKAGVPGKQLVAAGFAWHQPTASNRSARGKRKNRRIEIVLLRASGG